MWIQAVSPFSLTSHGAARWVELVAEHQAFNVAISIVGSSIFLTWTAAWWHIPIQRSLNFLLQWDVFAMPKQEIYMQPCILLKACLVLYVQASPFVFQLMHLRWDLMSMYKLHWEIMPTETCPYCITPSDLRSSWHRSLMLSLKPNKADSSKWVLEKQS